jgi:mannose-1-phosphate guanylyltransferase
MRIVIRAGGVGTRLWPWSRQDRPKQFLPLFGWESPVQVAIKRFLEAGITDAEHIFVSVGKRSLDLALEQLPEIPRGQMIVEPLRRDTAAAVGLETIWVEHNAGPGVVASLGSDHYVERPKEFIRALKAGEAFIKENPEYLVTIACEPSRVETNYGHVKKGEVLGEYEDTPVHKVADFTEKPDYPTAEEYTQSGQYLWNANFFMWHTRTMLAQFRQCEPELYAVLMELEEAIKQPDFRESLRNIYPRAKKVAIDYAVLEPAARAGKMAVVPVDMGWSDIGSWATLTDAFPPDEDGNLLMGPVLAEDTENCTVVCRNKDRKVIATVGLDGLAIVDTRDAILVCPKDQSAKVKRLVERMKKSDEYKDLV